MMDKIEAISESDPYGGWKTPILILLAVLAGLFVSLIMLPVAVPGMADSLAGTDPKVFWYLSRGSAVASFWVLWISMALGLSLTGKTARLWPGAPQSADLHQYTSLLGLGLALFHALILTGDHYIQFTPLTVLIPFANQGYEPFWVGIGQVAFYVWLIVAFSFYVRKRIGPKTWRMLHYTSFLVYALVLVHGIASGTDSQALWAVAMYWVSGGVLLFLLIYRLLLPSLSK